MALAVQDLLTLPDLPLKIGAAQRILNLEAEKRARFRDAILPHEKGEFINGQTIMHSPARDSHNHVSTLITGVLSTYVRIHSLGIIRYEKALCGFSRNDYEPDIAWFGPEKAAAITPETTIYPVPDFIVEILTPATAGRDRGVKFDDYAAHGVREYWIVDPDARTIDTFLLPAGGDAYQAAGTFADGVVESASFPGLSVPLPAFFDDQAQLAFLRELLHQSPA